MIQTSHHAAAIVCDMTGLEDVDSAMSALGIVAAGIVRRLPPGPAQDFIAQLPSELHEALLELPAGPDANIGLDSIQADLAARFDLELEPAAQLMRDVGVALRQLVSRGELRHVSQSLPSEMRQVLPDVVPHPTP